jgi:hypothetical protein
MPVDLPTGYLSNCMHTPVGASCERQAVRAAPDALNRRFKRRLNCPTAGLGLGPIEICAVIAERQLYEWHRQSKR